MAALRAKLAAVRQTAKYVSAAKRAQALDVVWFNCLSFYDVAPLTRLAQRLGLATVQSYEDERRELVSHEALAMSRRLFAVNSRLADRWCPARADAVVTISSYLRAKYSSLVKDPERVFLVPTIVDCEQWKLPAPPEGVEPYVLYIGTFSEQDDLAGIVDALGQLKHSGVPYRATLLGANRREAYRVQAVQRRIQKHGIEDRVTLRGFLPLDQVREEIARSHVLLNLRREGLWSRSGLSTKLSESLASGRLVIASAIGDVPFYLRNDKSALVVPAGASAQRIAEALTRACTDRALRRRLGAAGREVALRQFDIPVVNRTLEAVLAMAVSRQQNRE
jgi:glycosyltransferase involved in cell wall biosynthesis